MDRFPERPLVDPVGTNEVHGALGPPARDTGEDEIGRTLEGPTAALADGRTDDRETSEASQAQGEAPCLSAYLASRGEEEIEESIPQGHWVYRAAESRRRTETVRDRSNWSFLPVGPRQEVPTKTRERVLVG